MIDQTTQIAEVEFLLEKVKVANIPTKLKEELDLMLRRIRRMARQGQESGEYESVAKFFDWCSRIPWVKYNQDNLDLDNAKKTMDSHHYGGEEIKQAIIEYLAVLKKKQMTQSAKYEAPAMCFIGPQGTGKTTMTRAIAEALGRPFYRIALGALSSSSELRGRPKGTPDAEPGQIIKALATTGSLSPVILLDEIDKVSGQEAILQDFMAILLEILDPQQNTAFRDHYIDYPIDLSRIFFICTANTLKTITRALLDRLEIVEFKDYTPEEKAIIARDYLTSKILEYASLSPQELQFSNDVWPIIIDKFGKDPGIRKLESNIERLARKVTKQIVTGETQSVTITPQNINNYVEEAAPLEELKEKEFTGYNAPTLTTNENQEVQPNATIQTNDGSDQDESNLASLNPKKSNETTNNASTPQEQGQQTQIPDSRQSSSVTTTPNKEQTQPPLNQ